MRLQLALNVPDLDEAVDYYEKLLGVAVAKTRPGYANFEVQTPPLKLVLFESAEVADRLNHLGVEVFDDAEVAQAAARQRAAGLTVNTGEEGCCFATQNKAVSYAPDGTMWEWYRKITDTEEFGDGPIGTGHPQKTCC